MTAGAAPERELRVVIVDDSDVVRAKLRSLFDAEGLRVVGDAPDGASGVLMAGETEPDVIVMDLQMPGLSGVEATWKIGTFAPHLPVLILTVSDDKDDIADAVMAGAKGYIVKGAPDEEIVAAVRSVAAGQTVISHDVAGTLVRRGSGQEEPADPPSADALRPQPPEPPPEPPQPAERPASVAAPPPPPPPGAAPSAPTAPPAPSAPEPELDSVGELSLFKIGVITLVGVLLTALNQGAEIADADTDAGTWVLVALNFLVVFAVWELAVGPLGRGRRDR